MTLRAAAEQFTTKAAVRSSPTCGCVTDSSPSDADLDELIDQASDVLCNLSGGRVFGRQQLTVYPYRTAAGHPKCACCGLDAIPLGEMDPVVSEVKIDGVALDPADYSLHHSRTGWNLVRVSTTDRPNTWPSHQAMWRPNTEDDTFSVTYTHGIYIDWVVERAAVELVCDFAADDIRKTNQLPQGTVGANMGGVNVNVNSRFTLQERLERLQAGDLGPAVSRFRSIYAPDGRRPSEVWAPELAPWTMTVKQ